MVLLSSTSLAKARRRHAGDVYRYALSVLLDPVAAAEVTRTTFANAARAVERGLRPPDAKTWLLGVAHGLCARRLRSAATVEDRADDELEPDADELRRALGRLPFAERSALVLRELEARSCAEIAEALGLPVEAVETLLFRARRALRQQLDGALTCLESERALSRLADRLLAGPERASLRRHLRECDGCRRVARSYDAQRAAFRKLAASPLPAGVDQLAQVSEECGI